MIPADLQKLVASFYDDIWNRGDLSFVPALLGVDFTFRGSRGAARRGHEGFSEYVRAVRGALDEYRCDIVDLVCEGSRAFARMRFSGVHRADFLGYAPTGERIDWMGAALFTAGDDGRLADLWVLGDVHGLLGQLEANRASSSGR